MQQLLVDAVLALFAFSAFIALFFFVLTRGTLLVRALSSRSGGEASHVYPIYSNMRLIKLIDYQFIISAIQSLTFQGAQNTNMTAHGIITSHPQTGRQHKYNQKHNYHFVIKHFDYTRFFSMCEQ